MSGQIISRDQVYERLTEVAPDIWVKDRTLQKKFCEVLIEKFNNDGRRRPGTFGVGVVDKKIKDSTDLNITHLSEYQKFDKVLFEALSAAIRELLALFHDELKFNLHPEVFARDTGYQIQRTDVGGHYVWHTENDGRNPHNLTRTLAFIFYANEVEKGGNTGFMRQKCEVQPAAGRLVLFPPYWGYIHCGLPVEAGVKYTITGWLHGNAR